MRVPAFAILLLFFTAPDLLSQTTAPPLLGNPASRSSLSLDGPWHVIVDPYENGLTSRYFENKKAASKRDLIEYEFATSPILVVPGDWNTQKTELFFYEGAVWYEKPFVYHRAPHKRVFLHFDAANSFARAYLNGKELGTHIGGFTPFDFEVTGKLVDGDNFVVVEVNNTRHADGVPALSTDWWNYGGLTGGVALIDVPDSFIENYFVQLARNSANEINGWVQLNGAAAGEKVTVEIPEAHVTQTAEADANGRASFHFSADLQLWSPEKPKLYQVTIKTSADSVSESIGFRTIEARGTRIFLNGKPIFLRGVSFHDEAPARGRTVSEADSRLLLSAARDLGCNFVRLAHYPHNENTLRLADQMGLLVWSEIPVYWGIDWANPFTFENAKSQMRDMIARDQNHAAIILWSLSNETPVLPARTEFLKNLAAATREMDDTRLLTSAMNKPSNVGPGQEMLDDPLGEFLDVLGLNEYVGWYSGTIEDLAHLQYSTKWKKPLIVSEFGADALAGAHADAETRFSEEYQARLYEAQIAMLTKIPELAGMTPWVLFDFRSPRRPLPVVEDYYNRKGLISTSGQKKQAFSVLHKFYEKVAIEGLPQVR